MWYWIWGIAERAELDNWRPRKFWWLLQRLCARHHGFGKPAQQGNAAELLPPVARDVEDDAWVKGTKIP